MTSVSVVDNYVSQRYTGTTVSTLLKDRHRRAQRSLDTQRAIYRGQLQQETAERLAGFAQADAATRRVADLLPGAQQAGISVVEAAELTGISRPTLYRMLADSRKRQELRGLAQQFEQALGQVGRDLGRPALPDDLRAHFQRPLDEVFDLLRQLYDPLTREVLTLGPGALTTLVDLLPGLSGPEKIVLNMLLLQWQPTDEVARSTKLTHTRVMAWAALGLLRVLPQLRATAGRPLL